MFMDENKTQDAEIISESGVDNFKQENSGADCSVYDEIGQEESARKEKLDFRKKMALLFVLGFLIGIALKTEALKKITIGYNDYQMKIQKQDYDINKLQTDVAKQAQTQVQPENGQVQTGDEGAGVPGEQQLDSGAGQ